MLPMTPVPNALLALLSALGALDAAGRREAGRRRQDDATFDAQVEMWERRLSALALDAAPPIVPPDRLWDRIESALDAPPPSAPAVRLDDPGWEPWSEGIETRVLTRDGSGHPHSMLMRLQPGATLQADALGPALGRAVECLVIEGDVQGGRVFGAGEVVATLPVTARSASLLYLRTDGSPVSGQ